MSKAKIVYEDIPVGASETAVLSGTEITAFSTPQSLMVGLTPSKIATFEHNMWVLNGSFNIYDNDSVAFWSSSLSDSNCSFTTKPTLTISLTGSYTTLGLSFQFATEINNYVSEMTVYWYNNSTLITSETFTIDSEEIILFKTVENYNKIVVEINKTQLPYTRAKINKFMLGIVRTFYMNELRNVSIQQECDPISNALSTSTLNFSLNSLTDTEYVFQSKQPLKAYHDDILIGTYYIKNSNRKDKRLYTVNSEDAIGVLEYSTFSSKIYDGTTLVSNDISDIVGDNFEVELDSSYASTYTPAGYILKCSSKEALRQICFAIGASVSTMNSNKIIIKPSDTTNPTTITKNEIFSGASVEIKDKVTKVIVSAHLLAQDSSGDIDINGVKYKDTITNKEIDNPTTLSSDKPNVLTVTNMTLINPNILDTVAQRVYNYLIRRNNISEKIILNEHEVGDYITTPTKWDSTLTGNIVSMSITLSNLTVADCEILAT